MANSILPVTRLRPDLSSNAGSRSRSSFAKSAVALTSLTGLFFSGALASAASTSNSLSVQVPLNDRPGPLAGRFASVNSSSRKALIWGRLVVASKTYVNLAGA